MLLREQDVWLLGLLESLVVVVLVAVAPLKRRLQAGDSSAPHAKVWRAVVGEA